ncbi:MAG TPA: flavoprotein [Candidatus Limnocylindrales bacterium]
MTYLVVCGAPPARAIAELVKLLQDDGWEVCVIPTAAALAWLDSGAIERLTGHPVETHGRTPDEPKRLGEPALVIVAPATFNTINKWALGINDTPALGVLNEALGAGLPIVASPYAKLSLSAHPAFDRSLAELEGYGVRLTRTEALRPDREDGPFQWSAVMHLVHEVRDPNGNR